MRIPTAADIVKKSQSAQSAQSAQVEAIAAAGVDPVRLGKAAEGLLKLATPSIVRYFDSNVAQPFRSEGWTADINLAHVPQWIGFTALGRELKAAHSNDAHMDALTAPLSKLLESKGYQAKFSIQDLGDENSYYRLMVSLKPRDA